MASIPTPSNRTNSPAISIRKDGKKARSKIISKNATTQTTPPSNTNLKTIANAKTFSSMVASTPKLQGRANWDEWSEEIQAAAKVCGIWEYINDEGEEHHPFGAFETEILSGLQTIMTAEVRRWFLDAMVDCDATAYWRLKWEYGIQSPLLLVGKYLDQLTSIKLGDFPSVEAYAARICRIRAILSENQPALPDLVLTHYFLKGLPERYDQWKISVLKDHFDGQQPDDLLVGELGVEATKLETIFAMTEEAEPSKQT